MTKHHHRLISSPFSWFKYLALAAISLTGTFASAASISVSNPSFENPTGSALNGLLDPANGAIGAWSFTRTGVLPQTLTDVTFGASPRATNGANTATMNFLVGAIASAKISQNLGVPLLPASVYTLTFDAGQVSGLLQLLTAGSVSLTAGLSPVATLSGSDLLAPLNGTGPLTTMSLRYTTGPVSPSGNLGVEIQIGGLVQVLGAGLMVDNVRVQVVPALSPSVVSRKIHGAVEAYDIDLPQVAPFGIECRTGGANGDHRLILTFPTPVSIAGNAIVTSGTGIVNNTVVNGAQVTIDLTGVANAHVITVMLPGATDGINIANVSVSMGVLLGDTNGDARTNAADTMQTKSRAGQTVASNNCRSDVDIDGRVNSSDAAIVRAASGLRLP